MKKTFYTKLSFLILGLIFSYFTEAQVLITSTPDSTALLNETYSYKVEAATLPPGSPVTFSLLENPSGMTINSSTGVISWVPTSIFQGGKVVVKATKSATETSTQTYFVYVTDAIECLPDISTYLNLDDKIGTTLPDIAGSNDAAYVGVETNEPLLTEGKVGKALRFDPKSKSDIFYEIQDQDQYEWKHDTAFSFVFWFKNRNTSLPAAPETFLGRATSSGNPASWTLQWLGSDHIVGLFLQAMDGSDTIVKSSGVISDTNWHHIALVVKSARFASTEFRIFIDNEKTTSHYKFGVTRFENITPVTIGYWGQYPANTYPLSGYMDDLAIFNRELSDEQITQLYERGVDGTPVCKDGNFTPLITSKPATEATEDVEYSYSLIARDYESPSLVKSAVEKPDWLSFNTSTGLLKGTPENDDVGDHTIILRVSDGVVNVDQTFTIRVANVNDPPTIASVPSLAVDEDVLYTYTLKAVDVDKSDIVTLSAPVLPAWLSFNTSTGVLSGTPTNDLLGTNASATYDVTLKAADKSNTFVEQKFTITVTNVNDAPVINDQSEIKTDEDVAVTITLDALNVTDVDNVYPDDFTLTVKEGSNYSLNGNTITPSEHWNGTLIVPVELSDGEATVSYDVSVEVVPVDDPPLFVTTPVTSVTAGSNYQYWITCEDVEDQELTITSPDLPAWLSLAVNRNTALLQGIPANSDAGEVDIVLNVTDGTTEVQQTFKITVSPNTSVKHTEVEFASVYPIPASDHVNFIFAELLGKASLEIFTNNGVLIRSIDISGLTQYRLDISDLKPNQYIYRLSNRDKVQKGHLIVK